MQPFRPSDAFRIVAANAYTAFVNPAAAVDIMNAVTTGWSLGQASENPCSLRWDDELDAPLVDLRHRVGTDTSTHASY